MSRKKTLYVDGDAIISERPSGIGTATVSLIRALSTNPNFTSKFQLSIIVAANKINRVDRWQFNDNVKVKVSFIPGRVFNGLLKYHLLPPMDIFFGKGVYLFPNFRNWPLLLSPSATYIHDVSFKVYPEFIEPRNLRFLEANISQWIKRTSRVVTVSQHALTEIEKYYPEAKGKIGVVYNGIDETFKPLDEAKIGGLLKSYDISYKKYFMFLSNIEPRKNLLGVLAAYELFCNTTNKEETALLIVGGMSWADDDVRSKIRSMKEAGYRIIKPDHYVEDKELPALLSGAMALVHPAFYEGFGISPLQAMACGTQVIVSENSSLPEVVGEAGIYVDPGNFHSISSALERVCKTRSEQNTAGIKRASRFTWAKSAELLIQELTEIDQGGKR